MTATWIATTETPRRFFSFLTMDTSLYSFSSGSAASAAADSSAISALTSLMSCSFSSSGGAVFLRRVFLGFVTIFVVVTGISSISAYCDFSLIVWFSLSLFCIIMYERILHDMRKVENLSPIRRIFSKNFSCGQQCRAFLKRLRRQCPALAARKPSPIPRANTFIRSSFFSTFFASCGG